MIPLSASLTLTGLILTTFCEAGEVSLFPFSDKGNRAQNPERNFLAQWVAESGFKLWTSGFRVQAVSQVCSSVMPGFFPYMFSFQGWYLCYGASQFPHDPKAPRSFIDSCTQLTLLHQLGRTYRLLHVNPVTQEATGYLNLLCGSSYNREPRERAAEVPADAQSSKLLCERVQFGTCHRAVSLVLGMYSAWKLSGLMSVARLKSEVCLSRKPAPGLGNLLFQPPWVSQGELDFGMERKDPFSSLIFWFSSWSRWRRRRIQSRP